MSALDPRVVWRHCTMALNISPPYLGCEKVPTCVISFIDKLKSSLVSPDLVCMEFVLADGGDTQCGY